MLIHFNVRDIKIGEECRGEQSPFLSGTVTMATVPPLCLSENTCCSQVEGSLRLSEAFHRHCFWASITSNSCGCELRNQFLIEFLLCAGPGPYAGFTEVSQAQFLPSPVLGMEKDEMK